VLVGAETGDVPATADELARKIAGLRVFEDADGKMNHALGDVGGAVLAVSQFTLAADLSRGRRPGFERALRGPDAAPLYERFVASLRAAGPRVETGVFGASMEVELVNDGPATFLLEIRAAEPGPRRSESASG
jgi:D-tyrosyl-tRNA(Tyr) deacylase